MMMNEATPEVKRFAEVIGSLPVEYRQRFAEPLKALHQTVTRRKRILNLIQDALSQLRLDMKYLMFDLDATRRERDDYKTQLEKK
jgi:nitric oxide reductase activation protein